MKGRVPFTLDSLSRSKMDGDTIGSAESRETKAEADGTDRASSHSEGTSYRIESGGVNSPSTTAANFTKIRESGLKGLLSVGHRKYAAMLYALAAEQGDVQSLMNLGWLLASRSAPGTLVFLYERGLLVGVGVGVCKYQYVYKYE